MKKRLSARRAATFLATLGVLVMSSGVALMAAATPANAIHAPGHNPKVVVCKYVSTPGGELSHVVIVSENTLNSVDEYTPPADGDFWTDAQGGGGGSIALRYATDGEQASDIEASGECPEEGEGPVLCPEGSDNAGEEIPDGETEESFCNDPEEPVVCPEGTDNAGQEIPEGQTAEEFCDEAVVIVDPPETPTVIVDPPTTKTPTVTTPTVVSAGLTDVAKDMRGEQGLALVFAGMLLLLGAGGLGLRVRGGAAQA